MMNVRGVMVISIVDVNEGHVAQQRPQQEIQVNHNLLSQKPVSRNEGNEIHA